MKELYFWQGIFGNQDLLERYKETIDKLLTGEYQSADLDLKKSQGYRVFSVKINRGDRLLFTTIRGENNQPCLLLLEEILNHDYQKSKFLRNPKLLKKYAEPYDQFHPLNEIDELSFLPIESEEQYPDIEVDKDASKSDYHYQIAQYFRQDFIPLSTTQAKSLSIKTPGIIFGGAGTGKSCIALSMVYQTKEMPFYSDDWERKPGKVLFVTSSERLITSFYDYYQQNTGDEETENEVYFKTYDELLLSDFGASHLKEMGESHFKEWFEKNPKLFKAVLKHNLLTYNQVHQEFRIISGYEEKYLKLGKRESLFIDETIRSTMLDAYRFYQKHLIKERLYDPAFYEIPNPLDDINKYDLIIVDEAQDFSLNQLRILKTLANQNNICYYMDNNQSLFDEQSKRSYLKKLFFESGCELSISELEHTYRCPESVVKVASLITSIKGELIGGALDKGASESILANPDRLDKGSVTWHDALTDADILAYKEAASYPDFAIVTREDQVEKIKKLLETDLVFTATSIKGFEYTNVMLHGLLDDEPIFEEASSKLKLKFSGKEESDPNKFFSQKKRSRAKDGEKEDIYGPPFNQLFTAVTRATHHLIFVQEPHHKIEYLTDLLKSTILELATMDHDQSCQITRIEVEDEWLSEAQWLYQGGNKEKARAILERPNILKPGKTADAMLEEWEAEIQRTENDRIMKNRGKANQNESQIKPEPLPVPEVKTKPQNVPKKGNKKKKNNNPPKSTSNRSRGGGRGRGRGKSNRGRNVNKQPIQTSSTPNKQENQNKKAQKILRKYKFDTFPLHSAVEADDLEAINYFIEQGADLNKFDDRGMPPAFVAVENGQLEVLRLLADRGADLDKPNHKKVTPALVAAENGYLEVLRLLADRGADLNKPSSQGVTPAFVAAYKGHLEVLRLLADRGADLSKSDHQEATPGLVAAQSGHLEVLKLLAERGVDLNKPSSQGVTPAFVAAQNGHLEVLKWLAENEVDLNESDYQGTTLALVAAENGHLEVLKWLADRGVDLNEPDHQGTTPAFVAAQNGYLDVLTWLADRGADLNQPNHQGATPASVAAYKGHLDVLALLADRGADLNQPDHQGATPAFAAAEYGQLDVLRLLADRGADLNLPNNQGVTLAFVSAQNGYLDVLRLLADRGGDLSEPDHKGATPALVAAYKGHLEVLEWLADRGVDLNQPNHQGATLAFVAAYGGHLNVLEWLAGRGVDLNQPNDQGVTPAFVAVENGHLGVFKWLTDREADLEPNKEGVASLQKMN